jgi:hypothetical protein
MSGKLTRLTERENHPTTITSEMRQLEPLGEGNQHLASNPGVSLPQTCATSIHVACDTVQRDNIPSHYTENEQTLSSLSSTTDGQTSYPQVPASDEGGETSYHLNQFGYFLNPTIGENEQTLSSLSSTTDGQTSYPQVPAPDESGETPYHLNQFGCFWNPAMDENELTLRSLSSTTDGQTSSGQTPYPLNQHGQMPYNLLSTTLS